MSRALDKALEAIQSFHDRQTTGPEALVLCKCGALMVGYDRRWSNTGWWTVSTEEQFHLPIVNPESTRESRTYTQAGVFDGIAAKAGKQFLLEHKTTSESLEDINSPYWRRLTIDNQVSSYNLANWQMGRKLDGTLYDVIRKPAIRPKALDKNAVARIAALGEYYGQKVPDAIRKRVITKDQIDECLTLFGFRLRADVIERPNFYYARRMVHRLDTEMLEWADTQWSVAQDMRLAYSGNKHYRNTNSCMNYGTPCEYLGLCSGHDTEDSDRWTKAVNVHDELSLDGNGRDVLTHSRISCFLTCRKKEYYRYGLGLRRAEDEEKESIYFGTVFHAALAAWWECQTPEDEPCQEREPSPA